jgi:hypothetical protein
MSIRHMMGVRFPLPAARRVIVRRPISVQGEEPVFGRGPDRLPWQGKWSQMKSHPGVVSANGIC